MRNWHVNICQLFWLPLTQRCTYKLSWIGFRYCLINIWELFKTFRTSFSRELHGVAMHFLKMGHSRVSLSHLLSRATEIWLMSHQVTLTQRVSWRDFWPTFVFHFTCNNLGHNWWANTLIWILIGFGILWYFFWNLWDQEWGYKKWFTSFDPRSGVRLYSLGRGNSWFFAKKESRSRIRRWDKCISTRCCAS